MINNNSALCNFISFNLLQLHLTYNEKLMHQQNTVYSRKTAEKLNYQTNTCIKVADRWDKPLAN